MISQTIKNDSDNKIDFYFSKADKEHLIEKYGIQRVEKKIFTAIRENNVPIIYSFSDHHPRKVKDAIKSTIKFSMEENIINSKYDWHYHDKIQNTPLLSFPTQSQILSTLISSDVRYREQLNEYTKTPEMLWNDDEILGKAIKYVVTKSSEQITQTRIRTFCMNGVDCKYGTAFPISVAMFIMREQSIRLGRPISVVDPCAGWGDRMTAAMLLGDKYIKSYIGMDPWSVSNKLCKETFVILRTKYNIGKDIEIKILNTIGAEHKWPVKSEYDLVFTSPPYADLEKYGCNGEDKYQAWKYEPIEKFGTAFLEPMLKHACKNLAKDGRIIININNYKNKLIDIFLQAVENSDLQVLTTYGMALNSRFKSSITSTDGKPVKKAEPIFILEK